MMPTNRDQAEAASTAPAPVWTELKSSQLASALAEHEKFVRGLPGGRRARLANHNFEGGDFSRRNLTEIDLVGTKLAGCMYRQTKLIRANMFAADVRRAQFDGADLTRADLRGVCF